MKKFIFLFQSAIIVFFLCDTHNCQAGSFTSKGNGGGAWTGGAATWVVVGDADNIPDADDDVTILVGDNITWNTTNNCLSLTVNGTLTGSVAGAVININGNYSVSGSEAGTGQLSFKGSNKTITATGATLNYRWIFYNNTTILSPSVASKGAGITISNTYHASVTVTNQANVTTGTVTTTGGAVWINDVNSSLTINGTGFMAGRTFTANAAGNTVTLKYTTGAVPTTTSGFYNLVVAGTIAGSKTLPGATVVANNLTINATNTLDVNGFDLSVGGNWSNAGTFTAGAQTVTFNGAGAQSIGGASSTTFFNLTKNAAGTTTLGVNTIVNNLLNISGGIFNASTFGLTGTGGLTQTGGELQLAKLAVTLPELSGAYAITGGKVTFNGAGAQTIRSVTYNDVDISGSGTKTAGGALDIDGILTISSTLDMSGSNYALMCAGNFINNGTFTPQSGTITFDGTSTVSGSSVTSFNNVTITGTLTGHATSMNVAGNWVNTGTYTHNSGTIVFNGTTTVSGASATSFNNVTITGTLTGHATSMNVAGNWVNTGTFTHNSGTVVFNGTSTVSGASTTTFNNVTITGTLTGHATNMNVAGTFTSNSTFNHNNGTVTFNGGAAQSITTPGTLTFYGMTINNLAGLTLTNGTYVLSDVLTLNNGTFNINNKSFTMAASAAKYSRIAQVTGTGAVSNASNFNVQRYISARDTTWSDMASPNNGTMADWHNNLYFSYPHNPYGNPAVYSNVLAYNEAIADYVQVSDATALSPGKGFEIFLSDNTYTPVTPVTVTTTGTPNIAQAAVPLGYTTTLYGGAYAGQNLVGNPYASAVTIGSMTFTHASTTVDVYDWTTTSYQPVSGAGIIGPGQGFWAYATSAGASVLIPETAKSANQVQILRSDIVTEPYMTLKLSSADNSHQMAYTLRIASNSNAVDGFDFKEDHPFRKSPSKAAVSLTSILNDGKKLSINTFNSSNESYTMPLATQAGVSGFYKIEAGGLELMNEYRYITLEDKLLKKMVDLKVQQAYSFKFNSTDKQDRFVLHFSKNSQPVINSNEKSYFADQVEILPSVQGNTINFNLSETTNTTITFVNVLGQTIVDPIAVEANNQSINASLPEGFSGLYFVKIESTKGTITKKFMKN